MVMRGTWRDWQMMVGRWCPGRPDGGHDSLGLRRAALLDAAVQAFEARCNQAVAADAPIQAYMRQVEQDYDATGDTAPHPQRDGDFNPEQLMHELEEFLRTERERGAA